ncbi:MAG: SRPBCC family protein [Chitinophagaceae bacterium]
MAVYTIRAVQQIPADINTVWDFFSRPDNLQQITPKSLDFTIISKHNGNKIYAGQIIEYKLRPLLGIQLYWMTEITHVQDRVYFVDEQRFGPYALWHHQHHFKEIPGGIEMTDIVHYKIPFWFLGDIANALFVRRQLKTIFDFRYQKTSEMLGAFSGERSPLIFR